MGLSQIEKNNRKVRVEFKNFKYIYFIYKMENWRSRRQSCEKNQIKQYSFSCNYAGVNEVATLPSRSRSRALHKFWKLFKYHLRREAPFVPVMNRKWKVLVTLLYCGLCVSNFCVLIYGRSLEFGFSF